MQKEVKKKFINEINICYSILEEYVQVNVDEIQEIVKELQKERLRGIKFSHI